MLITYFYYTCGKRIVMPDYGDFILPYHYWDRAGTEYIGGNDDIRIPLRPEYTNTEQSFIAPDPITLNLRQRFAESTFDDTKKSPRGALGAYQIMPGTYNEYVAETKNKGDLRDYAYNRAVRDWYLDKLSRSQTVTRGNPKDDVRLAKLYAAYNWGVGNLGDYLQGLKNAGEDIYGSTGWVEGLPEETRNYVNWIVFGKETPGTNLMHSNFDKAYADFIGRADGGRVERLARRIIDGGYEYAGGGKIRIKDSKKGTFTAAASKHGKSVQAFASQVLAHPGNYSPAMVKKANFARNAAKWHWDGGFLKDIDR